VRPDRHGRRRAQQGAEVRTLSVELLDPDAVSRIAAETADTEPDDPLAGN
jgi:hypothetical protein